MARSIRVVYVVIVLITVSLYAKPHPEKVKKHPLQGVEGEYIVVLNEGTKAQDVEGIAQDIARRYKVELKQLFAWSLQGFLVHGKEKEIEELAGDDRVLYVEQNAVGQIEFGDQIEDPNISATQYTWWNNEYQWHLDRLDEPSWAQRDGTHNMCTEGRNSVAYIIDTGVWKDHSEFVEPVPSRVIRQLNFQGTANGAEDTLNGCTPQTIIKDATHGTAVASVLAGTHIGAAKTQIVSLRVFNCSMQTSITDMIEAIDWIASPANIYQNRPGVINLSAFMPVSDGATAALGDAAVRTVNATNIPFFSSADNYSTDACQFSPKNRAYTRTNSGGRVFVVGGTSTSGTASDNNDYRFQDYETVNGQVVPKIGSGSGSNGGPCVSIYAPAVSIYIAVNTGTTRYTRANGTSFSSPLVAAIAARYMEKQKNATGVTPTALQVYNWLLAQSTTVVQNTNTAPTYWVCARTGSNGGWVTIPHRTFPASCPSGYSVVQMNFATNTSNARMVYWDEGFCP